MRRRIRRWWRWLLRRPTYIGTCPACRTSVRQDDDWRWYFTGPAHKACVDYARRGRAAA